MIKKLTHMPYAQAHVCVHENGDIELISYATSVCTITADGWLTCTGTYSMTTAHHISAFMREYGNGFDYYSAKECYIRNRALNIYTAEIIEYPRG